MLRICSCNIQGAQTSLSNLPLSFGITETLKIDQEEHRRLLLNDFKNLVVIGKTTGMMLREDKISIYCDIKDAVLAFDEFRFDAELIGNCGRQTGGLREIVSRDAVGNGDFHCLSSSWF